MNLSDDAVAVETTPSEPEVHAEPEQVEQPEAVQQDAPEAEEHDEPEGDEEGTDDEPEQPQTPKKSRYARRLERKNGEIQALREQLAAVNAARPAERPATPVTPAEPNKPKIDDFDDFAAYSEALADWKVEQKFRAYDTQRVEREQQQAQSAQLQSWKGKLAAAEAKYPDWEDVMEDASSAQMTLAMREVFLDSDLGADLVYHLAKNPAEAERIAKLNPTATARELGKIEAKLTTPAAPVKKVSNAPNPIRPVGGRAAAVAKSLEELDGDEYIRRRNYGGKAVRLG